MSDTNRGLKSRGVVLCLLIFSGVALVSPLLFGDWPGSVAGAPTGSMFSYVVNIWMENKNYGSVLSGNSCCPYENSLANAYSTDPNYGSIVSPSLPDYLGFMGGSYPSCATGDGDPSSCNAGTQTNLVDRLESAGLTWKAYAENYPVSQGCTTSGSSGSYYARHFPFNYYSDIVNNPSRCTNLADSGTADSNFLSALNTTSGWPNFVWLTPNGCNDTHDCGASTGDTYLAGLVPKILNSNMFKTGKAVLVITWDEYNPAPNIEAGCCVKLAFKSSISANHYAWLKTLESNWALSSLTTNDANSPVLDMFTTGTVTGGSLTGSFSFSPSSPTAGQTVTFTGTGSGGTTPYTFKWGFGDGSSGTGNPVSHTYSAAGNYIASMTITDSAGGSFASPTQSLTVNSQQASTGNFNSSWYLSYSSPSSATLSNGIVTETVSNTCTGFNSGCAYWATAQWGTPCCPAPYYDSSGNLVAPVVVNASYVSATGKFTSVTTSGSTWHWSYYMGLYFQMTTAQSSGSITSRIIDGQIIIGKCDSSSGCASGGTSYNTNLGNRFGYREVVSSPVETAGNGFQLPSSSIWTFYQHALTAWGLPSNTKAVLFRVEPGAEGYGITPFTVTWYTTNITGTIGGGPGQNHPPSLSVPGSVTATPGARIAFVVNATDPDVGETIAVTVVSLPSGASFDQSTRRFLWTPTAAELGSYDVTFTATDNGSPPMTSSKFVLITVEQAAQPPPSQPQHGPGVCFQCLLTPTTLTSLWLVTTAGLVGMTGMIGVFYLRARARLAAARRMRRLNRKT